MVKKVEPKFLGYEHFGFFSENCLTHEVSAVRMTAI